MNVSTKQSMPWFLLGLVIVAAIAAGVIIWQLNQHKPQPQSDRVASPAVPIEAEVPQPGLEQEPEADVLDIAENPATAQESAEVAEVSEQSTSTTTVGTASLDKSDAQVKAYLARSPAAELGQWLTPEHTIRKFVRAINAVEEGQLVSQHRPTVAPATPFQAQRDGEHWRLSEENFERYEPYIDALEQAGPQQLMTIYQYYAPLLEQAYQELGVDKGSFEQVTRNALQQVINAPQMGGDVKLSSTSVVFKYQDKELEQLPELHKLLIRIGPENRERVQTLAQKMLEQLEQPEQ